MSDADGIALPLGVMGTTQQGFTPFEELRHFQRFDKAGVELLCRLMSEELRHYPALSGSKSGRQNLVLDLTGEYYAEKGERLIASLLATATDDNGVGGFCRVSIRHWLADRHRRGPTGHIHRKVTAVLQGHGNRFERVPPDEPGGGWWRIAGSRSLPGRADTEGLVRVADAVTVEPVPAGKGVERRGRVASDDDLVALLTAVLGAAGGSLPSSVLTDVLAGRLPKWVEWTEASLEAELEEHPQSTGALLAAADPCTMEIDAQAHEVLHTLTSWERDLVPFLGRGNTDIDLLCRRFGYGRSVAYDRLGRTERRLREILLPLGDQAEPVARRLRRLCIEASGKPDSTVSGTSDDGDSTDIRTTGGA